MGWCHPQNPSPMTDSGGGFVCSLSGILPPPSAIDAHKVLPRSRCLSSHTYRYYTLVLKKRKTNIQNKEKQGYLGEKAL